MKKVKIELSKEEAFALFGFLSRYVYDKRLEVLSAEEISALRGLCHGLDDQLVEGFRAEYFKFTKKGEGH